MTAAVRRALLPLVVLAAACSGAGGDDAADAAEAAAPSEVVTATVTGAPPSSAPPAEPVARPSEPASSPGPLEPSEGFDTATIVLSSDSARIRMPVWVADEPQLRQRGLMERTSLPSDAGMLFVFEAATDGGFWMKNTRIPLSIAFIGDDGRVVETLDMQPCAADPCDVYAPGTTYRYAVEANLGFFDEHGVGPGWTVDLGNAVEAG